jgi:hypothetical protein
LASCQIINDGHKRFISWSPEKEKQAAHQDGTRGSAGRDPEAAEEGPETEARGEIGSDVTGGLAGAGAAELV